MEIPVNFPANPAYGTGFTRRRIRMVGTPGKVRSVLVDIFHEMRCTLLHDGRRITGIHGEVLRAPTTACPAAAGVLEELRGLSIDAPTTNLYGAGRPMRNCSHLFDLAMLSIAHAARGTAARMYEVEVPDESGVPVEISVSRDGLVVHRWQALGGRIHAPESLAEKPLTRGFTAWASAMFEGDMLEAATVLSRTYFISIGARVLHETGDGLPTATQTGMIGVCYAYSPERAALATFRAGNRRNFDSGVVETPWPEGAGRA